MGIWLSPVELDVLWEAMNLGELPLVLDVPSPGATYTERAHIVRQTWDGLAARGVPTDLAQEWLRALATGRRSLELRAWLDGEVNALISSYRDSAVLAVLNSDGCMLQSVPSSDLAGRIVAVLPETPAGRGVSVSVRVETFAATADKRHGTDIAEALARDGLPLSDARVLVSMCEGIIRRGQFAATWLNPQGRRERARTVVGFHDTASGRYLTTRRGEHLTVTPADPMVLARKLSDLFAGT